MTQPQIRSRCYNCNASLEQATVTAAGAAPDASTEKRPRRTDLWSDAYTPRPEMAPKLPTPGERLPDSTPARADDPVQLQRSAAPAAVEPRPDAPPPSNPHTGKILRGGALAAEAASFASPPAKLRSRGSSGDPSAIAPRTSTGFTPAAMPRPTGPTGSGPIPVPGSAAAAAGAPPPSSSTGMSAVPRQGAGATPSAQPRPGRPPTGERPAMTLAEGAPPPPSSRALTPVGGTALERKRSGTVPVPQIPGEGAGRPAKPPTGQFQALEPERRGSDTVILRPGEGLSLDQVSAAIQQANEAAKNRAKLTQTEIEALARSYLEEVQGSAPASAGMVPEDDAAAPTATASRATPPPPSPGPHYLLAQVLGEPVQLSRDEPIRIGRGETNEIVFPLTQISRVHSEIRFDPGAGGFVAIDRNSTNGTFVNGKPIKRRRLVDGDKISVGPFTIVYRASNLPLPAAQRTRTGDDTEIVKSGALSGDIEEMPLPDVLRFMESLKKTGELAILSATGERGMLYCRDGQPIHAEFRDQIGIPAALTIIRLKRGSFRFASKAVQVERATVMASLTLLLKDAAASSPPT